MNAGDWINAEGANAFGVDAHRAQLLNYLRATDIKLGLLLNFGERPEFKRLISKISKREPTIRKKTALSAAALLLATCP